MNSSKKRSSRNPYFLESELFSSIQNTIDDQELLIQLKKFEGKYYQLFPQTDRSFKKEITNESMTPMALNSFSKEWQKNFEDCQIYFYNESLSYCYSNIKRCISKIHEVVSRLSSPDSFPRVIKKKYSRNYDEYDNSNDEESSYEQYIARFNEEFLQLKQVFNLKQYSQNFIVTFKKFIKKMPKYISVFSEANIDQNELSNLISIMQKKSNQIDNFISSIEQTQIPTELLKLDEIIRQKIDESNSKFYDEDTDYEEPRNHFRKTELVKNRSNISPSKNIQKPPSSFRQPSNDYNSPHSKTTIQSKNGRTTTQADLLNDIKSCSNRLKNISTSIDSKLDEEATPEIKNKKSTMKFLQQIQNQIDSEARFLNTIQKVDIITENNSINSELQNERQRNKLIFDILNKGQSALAEEIDTEKLKVLDKNQLISIVLSLCLMIKNSNNGSENAKKSCKLQIPLELTFCQGTPDEFKRLSQQFVETARYNEWAESKIKKLSSENVQLKSENEILSSQLNSKDNEYKLLNDLRKIDERIQFINSALEQKLQTHSQIGRPTQSLETTELNSEVEDLVKKKKKIKKELSQIIPNEMLSEIESLKKANMQLQLIAEARMRENEDLQKQILEFSSQAVKANINGENPNNNQFYDNEQNDHYYENDHYPIKNPQYNPNPNSPSQFNQNINQNSPSQFNQNINQNSPSQFNQNLNQNSPSQFNQNINQNSPSQFNEDEFENQQPNFLNRSRNSPMKTSNKFNVQQQQQQNFPNQMQPINNQQQSFSSRSGNSSIKMNRNNQFNDQQQNSPIKNSNNKFSRSGQFNNDQPPNFSPSAKQSQSNITRMNNSPVKKSNLQGQNNFTNNRKVSPNRNNLNRDDSPFFEEEEETEDEDQRSHQNYIRNHNRNTNARNNGFNNDEDDNFYQNGSEKKIKPRMRK